MNPVYYAIVRRVLPGSIAPTKNTENLEVMGLLSGDKFYFVNHLKMNGFRFGDGDPPTNIQVVMHTKRFLRNIEEDHVILRGHEKDNAYLLQFVDSAYWTTQAAFETFPVIHFRKRPRKLYLKKKRSAKAKSKRHPMKP